MRGGGIEGAVAVLAVFGASGCDRLLALAPVPELDAAKPPGDVAAAYAFDDAAGSGTLTDGSGNGNTAQLVGGLLGTGKYGTALQLDGDDRGVAPNSPSLDITGTGITIALWLRIDPLPDGDQVIVGKP